MMIDSRLLAVDPYDCGCTECITGVYIPLSRATDDHIQALLLGLLSDHTSAEFTITQQPDGTYQVNIDTYDNYVSQRVVKTYTVDRIVYPITVNTYTLDATVDTIVANLTHLGADDLPDDYAVL